MTRCQKSKNGVSYAAPAFLTTLLVSGLLLFTMPFAASACAVCGCGAGAFYLGISPQYALNISGIRFRDFSYNSHLLYSPALRTHEHFQVAELYTRFYVKEKWQVQAFIPYQYNRQQTSNELKTAQGMGDASVLVQRQIFVKNIVLRNTTLKQQLWLGVGIKAPTGHYQYNESDLNVVANPNFQLGTGSWDKYLIGSYLFRAGNWGLSLQSFYRFNGTNSDQYHFGNQLQLSGTVNKIWQINRWGIMPSIGYFRESSDRSTRNNYYIDQTGGRLTGLQSGVALYYRRYAIDCQFQKPLSQLQGGGNYTSNNRLSVGLTVAF